MPSMLTRKHLITWCRSLSGLALFIAFGCSGDSPTGVASPPTLTAVSPATGVQGTAELVTVAGTNFVAGSTTALVLNGGGITVTELNVTSSTSATAHVTIAADAPLGPRTIS